MKRGIIVLLLLFIVLGAISFIKDYTGAASKDGYPSGRYFPVRADFGESRFELSGGSIDEDGKLVVKAGDAVYFTLVVGSNGIRREVEMRNAVSDLKVDRKANICLNSYCADDNQDLCKGGPVCYENRKGFFTIPDDRKPGLYALTVCPGNLEKNECNGNEISSEVFLIVEGGSKIREKLLFRGQDSMI
mgnify:CR=1 FL=1